MGSLMIFVLPSLSEMGIGKASVGDKLIVLLSST